MHRIKKTIALLGFLLLQIQFSHAQFSSGIIPKPQFEKPGKGYFQVNSSLQIQYLQKQKQVAASAQFLKQFFHEATGFHVPIKPVQKASTGSVFLVLDAFPDSLGLEVYSLLVNDKGVLIRAKTPVGLIHGIQSLRQLMPIQIENRSVKHPLQFTIPATQILDFPSFRWRGLQLDCCRHFMSKEFVLRYIDLLSFYKLNKFHWHLTEDQGWRIEIKAFPLLTQIGSKRVEQDGSEYGGYYTQEQIREVVAYAKARHIEVIPEIEMPGHAQAALAAYPNLSCTGQPLQVANTWGVFKDIYCPGKEETFHFIEAVLEEVVALFPGEYVHIGGDEAPKFRWENCQHCQTRMRDEKLKDAHELQSYFIKRVGTFLTNRGKRMIGWDEILEGGLAPQATVQSWRGLQGAIDAAKSGHDAIVSPTSHLYFDYGLKSIDLEKVYGFEPIPAELNSFEAGFILGGECNMWTEKAPQELVDSKVFPRMLAMSEVLWTYKKRPDFNAFKSRLKLHYPRMDAMQIHYGYEKQPIRFESEILADKNAIRMKILAEPQELKVNYTLNGSAPTPMSAVYMEPLLIQTSTQLNARAFLGDNPNAELFSRTIHLHDGLKVNYELNQSPSQFYAGNGVKSLQDGQRGSIDFHDGLWLGWQDGNPELKIDLGKPVALKRVVAGALQSIPSWIFFPEKLELEASNDGVNFSQIAYLHCADYNHPEQTRTKDLELRILEPKPYRYYRLKAIRLDKCPNWHDAAGSKTWLFLDELMIFE